jgi:LacI family transcriptional regulator
MFEGLRAAASAAGFGVEFEYRPKLFKMRGAAGFSPLELLPDTAGWVLMYSTLPIQRWIASRGCPGVVFGTLYPGLQLPCTQIDTEASARHAAGLFHARGHRRMVFLMPEFTSLSDRLSGAAFVAEARRLGSHAVIATYKPRVADLRRTLDHLLVARPRPDAFFSNCAEHSMTLLCHLRQAGLAVPEDAAILCGWDDPFLEHAIPSIARYRFDHAKAGRRIGSMLLDVIQNGTGKCPHHKLLPDFVPGGTFR